MPQAPFRTFRITRRRALTGSVVGLVVFGLLLWWLLPLGDRSPGGKVTFSTGTRNGVYVRYGNLLDKALAHDLPRLDVTLDESQGSWDNVARVATGKADFTIAAADAVAKYQDEGLPGADRLRGCARLYDDYMQLIVPATSGVEKVADLRGKKVAVGGVRSGVRLIAEKVLAAAGLDIDKDVTPVGMGINDMADALRSKEIDAFFWSGGLPTNNVKELSEQYPIRLVEMGSLLDRLRKQSDASARYYRAAVMPADAYPAAQHGKTVSTLAVANLLVTTDRTSTELTEAVTRTVIDSRDKIGAQVHAAQLVDLRTAVYTDPLPLHEGARRYYRSVKP
ncbi:TAXI family TRAP transporter solute-binding subunit [Streptomyces sp. VRA16 Mangrove soil]|uniref:TAXI family TRAP transporter solute-binding subunit n=1 Tax=Streptomyces sp. VRA16 Mangrove soil TaxID=2817434 RepID=UPI001A9DDF01|nr:TAXI family TRAP transporter solute-binding subunit [Streptomyces sp. VRA16 Mangrove soil]MBO1335821.1 TAXI family TRAP transporter solute-binding subunit [Streptomyces sp. VRA16 Mangrove soil]